MTTPTLFAWRGVATALLVGVAFATNTSLAAVAYTGGATPIAVLLARTGVAFIVLFIILSARNVPRRIAPSQRLPILLVACLFASYGFCVMAAIQYLPVGVVIASFYIFPIFIALIEWGSGRQPFQIRTAVSLCLAFFGVMCALNVFSAQLHRLGTTFCLLGAFCVAIVVTLSARISNNRDSRPITLHMLGIALIIFTAVALSFGNVVLPNTPYAWFGFLAGPIFYTFGIITLFVVNSEIGPVKTSMIMNIEPVTSVALGFLLLDQRLLPIQLFGISVVVGTVLFMESAKQSQQSN